MTEHINGYALALFDLAKEEKKLIAYKDQSLAIIDAIEANEGIVAILNSKGTEVAKRQDLVKKAFAKVNKTLRNFLFILVERSKFQVAVPALKKLVKFINQAKKVNEGTVYSTEKLSPKQIKDIEVRTSKMIGSKVVLINKLDATLVSGIKIQVGDEVIEDTVLSRLEQIRNELLEREEN